MKVLIIFSAVVTVYFHSDASPTSLVDLLNPRVKRADCSSTYGAWSEWTDCSMNCGYCGKQNRSRDCNAVDGCDDPICTGDAIEIQSCGTNNSICYYPTVSCCDSNYKKTLDLPGKRFYCGLKNLTDSTDSTTTDSTSTASTTSTTTET
ncbi:unnamed protein product [Caenorhabditis sp. 36 PRJEB53466]|nr:unnamed protein product [Caenorhabditis sp. 36 PRJEB53466]